MNLRQSWKTHLKENNMTYCEHWRFAVGYGLKCVLAGIYLCIHGFLPCFLQKAGSQLVEELSRVFAKRS